MTDLYAKEKSEALHAGQRALCSLREAEEFLASAGRWGIFDMLGGGGLITHLVKRSRLDNADVAMETARRDLKEFTKELRDVSNFGEMQLDVSDFLSFADWFFDGLFVDWMVQSRIRKARKQVEDAIGRVEDILDRLGGI